MEKISVKIDRTELARVCVLHTHDEEEKDDPLPGIWCDVPADVIAEYRKVMDDFESVQSKLFKLWALARAEVR